MEVPTQVMISMVLPLIAMHWITLIRYACLPLYVIMEVVLEIWFQVTIYCFLSEISAYFQVCAISMLVAHYCYWSAAVVGSLGQCLEHADAGAQAEPEAEAAYNKAHRCRVAGRRSSVCIMQDAVARFMSERTHKQAGSNVSEKSSIGTEDKFDGFTEVRTADFAFPAATSTCTVAAATSTVTQQFEVVRATASAEKSQCESLS